jgi:MoaA/NifB/PqqE/SkfB family radical SAM enzyme
MIQPLTSAKQSPYQRILEKTYERRIPFTAHLEVTHRCNLRCLHCYLEAGAGDNELRLDEWETVLSALAQDGTLFLVVTGGEPMLREDIFDILAAAQRLGFAVRLLTNGTLIDSPAAEKLARCNLLGVDISLYAMDAGVHDAITRVPGSHACTLQAVRLCREQGMRVAVKTPLMKLNIGEFDDLSAFAEQVGASFVFDYYLIPGADGRDLMSTLGLSKEQIRDFIGAQVDHDAVSASPEAPRPHDPVCGAGANAVCISADGAVLPCLGYRVTMGNVRRQALKDIWCSPFLDRLSRARC